MAYSEEIKNEFLHKLRLGMGVAQICETLEIPDNTGYRWARAEWKKVKIPTRAGVAKRLGYAMEYASNFDDLRRTAAILEKYLPPDPETTSKDTADRMREAANAANNFTADTESASESAGSDEGSSDNL